MPRKVLYPFQFSDGTVVPTNNWIAVPQQAIMQDSVHYNDPSTFNPFRFLNHDGKMKPDSRFSTPSFEFPFWGGTKRPWFVFLSQTLSRENIDVSGADLLTLVPEDSTWRLLLK